MANLFVATVNIFFWKHWKCLRFSWIKNSLMILIPILLTWGQIHAFHIVNTGYKIVFDPIDQRTIDFHFPAGIEDYVFYTPNTDFNNKIMENVRNTLSIFEERIYPIKNETELDTFFQLRKNNHDFAIIFHDVDESSTDHYLFNYTIRTKNNNFYTDKIFLDDVYSAAMKETDEYIESGFLALQYHLDLAFRELVSNKYTDIKYEYEKFPANARDTLQFSGITITGVVLLFIYSFTLLNMVLVPMVEEKEDGVKEFLRIASSHSYLNNVTFFFNNVIIGCVIFGSVMGIAAKYGFINHIPLVWLIILFILYVMSAVAYTFLMTVIFDSVFYAKMAGFLCYIAPFIVIAYNQERMEYVVPLFNSALLLNGLGLFDFFGLKGIVFTEQNLFESTTKFYSIMTTYVLLLMNIVVYLLLYYYFSHVFPGKCGTPRPFYFPFMPSFYCTNKVGTNEGLNSENGSSPLAGEISVKIRGLTKVFRNILGRKNVAVNNLSMDIYKNQITVLLGHNGAGKTTTMSMISGIIPKTSGAISVCGQENIDIYRHKIGYCPQHNVFMRYFTCSDHLWFFGGLRGLSIQEAKDQTRILLERLKLTNKANEFGKNLSGGMKRRLCLGNALVGNTQIAILDEPSSGLDPESRRELWNILLEMRKNHTILITTHYMEEAETLADKIAIISHGELLCYGTSIHLKRKYATGYVLTLLTTQNFNLDATMRIIHQYIPDANTKSFVRPTIKINLSYTNFNNFGDMLKELENAADNLGISSISVTNCSLEEVFLNCDPRGIINTKNTDEVDSARSYVQLDDEFIAIANITTLGHLQFFAIIYKKMIYMREKWFYWFLLFMFPIAAIIISFVSINASIAQNGRSNLLNLNLMHLPKPEVLVFIEKSVHRVDTYELMLKHIIEKQNGSIKYVSSHNLTIEEELLYLEEKNITYHSEHIPVALYIYEQIGVIHVRVMFSGNYLHGSATALNLASNIILKMNTNDRYHIESKNEPLHRDKTAVTSSDLDVYLMFVPMALFFYALFYVSMPFNEERTEFKKLQGISPILYWLTYYLFDVVIHIIYCCFIYGIHVAADTKHIFGATEYTLFSTIYLFYGLAYIPIIYIVSQCFNTMSSLYSFLTYMFVGANIMASFMSSHKDNMESYSTYIMFLLLFPDYALRHALSAMFITFTKAQNAKLNNSFDNKYSNVEYLSDTSSYVGSDVLDLKRYYIYMICVASFFMIFLMTIWEDIYRKEKFLNFLFIFKRCRKSTVPICRYESNPDVHEEKILTDRVIKENQINDYAIVVSKLHKRYENVNAVRGIDFTVNRGECFGLLGMNGAGKTTTFKMLTRDATVTRGDIYFNGVNSNKYPSKHKFMFGYCPQVDALNDFMTAYETLKYMGMMRGIARDKLHDQVEKWIKQTDLEKYANVSVQYYSGGTKRKLNTALAMISDPCLVFLDEPTTGVDPTSRRFMWSCIQNCQKNNKNIVLTSHSMDECEYLCNRLAIMASGQLMCIGPVQQLKDTFRLGFVIIIMIQPNALPDQITSVKNSMTTSFRCTLKEEYAGKLSYLIQEILFIWSDVFQKVISIHKQYADVIGDISVCETSLEDIFLHIAKETARERANTDTSFV